MRSNPRKAMSILVALLLILSLLVACGGGTENATISDPPANAANTPDPVADPGVEEDEDDAPEKIGIDMNGRTIQIVAWWDGTPSGGTEMKDLMVKRREDVENRFNVKFEWLTIPAGEIKAKFAAAAMAGSTIGDLVIMRHEWAIPDLAKEGYLMPLEGLIDYNARHYNEAAPKYSEYDGKVYGFINYAPASASLLYFNKTLFEQNGIENIYDLVKNNEWTWEKFEEIAKKLTKDTNGDGITDVWGYGMHGGIDPYNWIYANGGEYARVEGTTPVSTLTDGRVIETLQWLNKLIKTDKIVSFPEESVEWDHTMKQFIEGKVAMTTSGWWMAGDIKDEMQDEFGIVPLPVGPGANGYTFTGAELQFYVVPSNIPDAEGVLMAFDALMQPLVPLEEIEEAEYAALANNVWDVESLETHRMMRSNFTYAQHSSLGDYWETIHPGIQAALNGEKSPTAAMEEVNPTWQASMDEKAK